MRLAESQEIIRGWKKEEILENSNLIWDNTSWIIEENIIKVENESSPNGINNEEMGE